MRQGGQDIDSLMRETSELLEETIEVKKLRAGLIQDLFILVLGKAMTMSWALGSEQSAQAAGYSGS